MSPENTSIDQLTPEVRKANFWAGIISRDLRKGLPPKLVAQIKLGETFDWTIPSKTEPQRLSVQKLHARDTFIRNNGYFGARDAGIVTGEDTRELYEEFAGREVVTVYSEPHGGVTFGYDGNTGQRFWPRDDVSWIDAQVGNLLFKIYRYLEYSGK